MNLNHNYIIKKQNKRRLIKEIIKKTRKLKQRKKILGQGDVWFKKIEFQIKNKRKQKNRNKQKDKIVFKVKELILN